VQGRTLLAMAWIASSLLMLGPACPPAAGGDKADEDAAVAALERLGGVVSRDSTLPGRPAVSHLPQEKWSPALSAFTSPGCGGSRRGSGAHGVANCRRVAVPAARP